MRSVSTLIRLAAIGFAFVIAALPAQAADVRVIIVEHGLYTLDVKSEKRSPDGVVDTLVENLCHYATTTTVPLKAGVHFGFRYRVDGLAAGEAVNLAKIVQLPMIVKPPGAPKPLSTIWRSMLIEAGQSHYAGYGLDLDWELMPGRWSLSIQQSDRKLAEMGFDVVAGADAPAPSTQETTCFKLSSL
jgi:hypothetical protein